MESLSETRMIDLGIRGVERRLKGARTQTIITNVISRVIAIGVILWLFLQLWTNIDKTKLPPGHLVDSLTIAFLYFESVAVLFFLIPIFLTSLIFGAMGGSSDGSAILLTARAFFTVDIFNNVSPPEPLSSSDLYGSDSTNLLSVFTSSFGYLWKNRVFFKETNRATILILAVVIFWLGVTAFLMRSDMRTAATVFASSQFIVLYAQTQLLFKDQLSYSPTEKIFELFSYDAVITALASYLFLEIALQTSYISKILNPTQDRQKRVLQALDRLKEFRLGVTPVTTEISKPEEEETKKEASKTISGAGSSLVKKYGATAVAFLAEKTKDSLFAKPGGRQAKLTGRLQRYHDSLVHSDTEVDQKLVGASVAVSPMMTIVYITISIIFRLVIMMLGLFLVLNPDILLFILRYPPSIYYSLELLEPEGVVLLLIPIIVMILLLTELIGYIQKRLAARISQEKTEEELMEEIQYEEEEGTGIVTEGPISGISEEELFYKQLEEEFSDEEE
ncbi:MAG: hypothetical protein K9W46_11485 [Candidatus Heimdallarchaeum endolithica]|uniref:Uncharacterized protein n=1 Tax=Candidatus Heimdallarchaeum endolithica TaxID=2876572 RepID=A0A9Y1FN13_9ARCH|nr:MAG: hypothetical protein K9W46_11485 [Candidatus Heimdallarchaeum endolithica]